MSTVENRLSTLLPPHIDFVDIVDTVEIVDIFDTFNIVDINEAIWNKARLQLKQSQKR